jgi:hypothetical protein
MEEFFTKVLNDSIKKCEKPFPLLIDFDLKHCIKTEHFKNRLQEGVIGKEGCGLQPRLGRALKRDYWQ